MIKKIFLTFILTSLIVLSFALTAYTSLFTKSEIKKVLKKTSYYDYTYKYISDALEMELPNEELDYAFSSYLKEELNNDIDTTINNYFAKKNNKEIEEKFKQNLDLKLEKYNNNSNIESLKKDLTTVYINNIMTIYKIDKIKLNFRNKAKIMSYIMPLITLALIIFLTFKDKEVVFNAFISTGILFILPKSYLIFDNFFTDFYFYNKTFSYFITNYIYYLFNKYFIIGLILIILPLILKYVILKNAKLNKMIIDD